MSSISRVSSMVLPNEDWFEKLDLSDPGCDDNRENDVFGKCIPPWGNEVGEINDGKAGEDAKCCSEGLPEGVGGITAWLSDPNVSLLKPGVCMVKFVGFLLPVLSGGAIGDAGAERGCVESGAAPSGPSQVTVGTTLSERFFTFLSLLPGDSGFGPLDGTAWNGGKPLRLACSQAAVTGRSIIDLNGDFGTLQLGDSGDELGEGSVLALTDTESNVDTVVVGDDSFDSVPEEVILPLCWKAGCKGRVEDDCARNEGFEGLMIAPCRL